MALAVPALAHARLREVLMVSLKPPPADWTDVIAGVADLFMNARVCFYEANTEESAYDPITGEGDEFSITLLWVGRARVQHLRSPSTFATDYQAGANRAFRFQAGKNAGVPFLSEGVKARVLDAGVPGPLIDMGAGDADLEKLAYVVNSAINASHQAVKTVELTATMRPVEWAWGVDDEGNVVYDEPFPDPAPPEG